MYLTNCLYVLFFLVAFRLRLTLVSSQPPAAPLVIKRTQTLVIRFGTDALRPD